VSEKSGEWGDDWSDPLAPSEAPQKRRPPTLALACGGGCLVLVAALVLALAVFLDDAQRFFQGLSDPEVQWPRLAEVLPFEERPDYGIYGMSIPMAGFRFWALVPTGQPFVALVWDFPASQGSEVEKFFDPEESFNPGGFLSQGRYDAEEGSVDVQGRSLRAMRYFSLPADRREELSGPESAGSPPATGRHAGEMARNAQGAGICLDLTRRGSTRRVVLQLIQG
jgi:hypothetical protein